MAEEKQKEEVKEPVELTAEEKQMLEQQRGIIERRNQCTMEIQEVLQKYRAQLTIDKNSPIGAPQIIVVVQQ